MARADVINVAEGESIADAITAAKEGDTVQLAAGKWVLSAQLVVDKGITLKGAGPDKTFIDGNWNGTLAAKQPGVMCLLVNSKDAVVSDLTVQHGYSEASTTVSSQGVGIRIAANGGTVRNCVITENCKWSRRTGCAGVSLNSADAVLENCVISDNKSSYSGNGGATDDLLFGAGVMCVAGRVSNCTISGNTGSNKHSRGGGLYLGTADAKADHCIVSGNKIIGYGSADGQQHGGGVYMLDGLLDNCLIVNNEASLKAALASGGGLYQTGGTVVNCTFARNSAYAGGGVCVLGGTFVNNLVCGNTTLATDATPDYSIAVDVTASNCCFPAYAADAGIGEQVPDSVFAKQGEDPFLSDYSIDGSSPCYDKGKDGVCSSSTDFFGNERVQGEHIDIGCAEATPVSGLTADFEVGATEAVSTDPVTFTASAYGPGVTDENTTFAWTDDRGVELGTRKVLSVCLAVGTRSITLTATSGEETVVVTKENCTVVIDGNVYVEKVATPTPPYNTKETAFTNLVDAVAYAQDGMIIHVGEGTFVNGATVTLSKRLRVFGTGPDKTVFDGGAKKDAGKSGYGQIFVLNNEQAVLSGVTVKNAMCGVQGAGVAISGNGGTVTNCWILENRNTAGGNGYGGGVYMTTAKGLVTHCVISGNDLSSNSSHEGGGVYMTAGRVENSLIVDNAITRMVAGGRYGGGVSAAGGTLVNCTIAGNTAIEVSGIRLSGTATAVNCIIYDNDALGPSDAFINCCFPMSAKETELAGAPGAVFVDKAPYQEDYTLLSGSSCEDRGADGVCTDAADLFGAVRVQGDHIDIGCAEATPVEGLVVDFEVDRDTGYDTAPVMFTGSAFGRGVSEEDCTFVWSDKDGQELGRGKVLSVILPIGSHSITLTVTHDGVSVSTTKPDVVTIADGRVLVELGATPTPPYNTKTTAFTNILDAIDYAQDGMMILVGEGTFFEKDTLKLTKRVRLVGAGPDATVVDASKFTTAANRTFYINNAQSTLSSLTVQKANANQYGAGIAIGTSGGTVSNCVVRNCSISGGNAGYGAGIYLYGSKGLVTHSRIIGNSLPNASAHRGAGLCMEGGVVSDCLIVGNTSSATGTGIQGGVHASGGRIVNCTVVGNFAYKAGGISLEGDARAVNCIVYGNTAHSSMEIADFNIEATNKFVNCCFPAYAADTDLAKASPGMVFVSSEPYTADYTLEAGSPCEDAGADGYCDDSRDLFGAVRVQGGAIDIGCAEATPSAEMVINFAATPVSAIGSADVTLTAFVSGGGAKPDLCTYEWTVGGETLTGRTVTRSFGVGRYDVTLKVTSQKGDVKELPVERAFVIYPAEVRVETAAKPAWPWDTAANAFTNLAEALEECVDGMTIRMGAGDYPVSRNITVSKAVRIIGAGMERTKLYRSIEGRMRVLTIDNVNAYVAELAVSGGSVTSLDHGGAIAFTEANGGVVEHCLITGCEGNDAVSVMGPKSYLRRSIIRGNSCTGVKIWKGGKCESCLITENTANYGAGVVMTENSQGDGYLRNCTVIRNHGTSKEGTYSGAGVYASGVTANRYIYNCLIVDNTLASEVEDPPPGYPDAYSNGDPVIHFDHCCTATEIGENCIFGVDPKVRRSGKIPFGSPCSRKGIYQSWMDGQLDLFGNPRTDEDQGVDIGCCQSRPTGMMLLVR